MLLTRLFCFFRGYLVITVTGKYPERFLNVCAAKHILIWDVFSCSDTVLKCSVSIGGFRLLPAIARKTNVHIKIIEKKGFPILIARWKKRKLFIAGLGLCLACTLILNQFVWRLEITGCKTISADYVKEQLARCGLYVGAFRPRIDEKKLQTDMLIQTPELAWLWVDKRGSGVTVEVEERVFPPAIYDPSAYCNLIAAKDGVIDAMIIKSGIPTVSVGDTVKKGDILTSGLILSEKGVEPRYVQSEGSIYARVWYEKTKAFSLLYPHITETGNSERKYTLHLFSLDLPLFRKKEPPFGDFEQKHHRFELNLWGFKPGLGISYTEFIEQNISYEKASAEAVTKTGTAQLLALIDEEAADDATLTTHSSTCNILDEETVEVTVIAEYRENIAEKLFPTQ